MEDQAAIVEELRHYFAGIDKRATDIPDIEQEEILDEAIRSVRPGYKPIR
jgi:hypothetical protein